MSVQITNKASAAATPVNTKYTSPSGTPTGSATTLTYASKVYENGSSGAYSGGTYTVPTAGMYFVYGQIQLAGTIVLNSFLILNIQHQTVTTSTDVNQSGGAQNTVTCSVQDLIPCSAGDTINFQVQTNVTGPSYNGGAIQNFMFIYRVSA